MILSNYSINKALSVGDIHIDPEPDVEQIQPASLDVRLGKKMYEVENDAQVERDIHWLHPGERYLGHTEETIELPKDIAAQLAGRSSVGRKGVIVHKTAGWIDPGFEGSITLELMNLGNSPVCLNAGNRVAQLVFFELDKASSGYDGRYQGQDEPTKAR